MHERTVTIPIALVSMDAGLEREFEALVTESSTLMFRVAYSVLRHRQDAEDVAQEAFVRAHRRFHQLRDRERFRAWVVRVTWRLALDHLRSVRRRATREQQHLELQSISTEASAIAAERAQRLWAAIDELSEKLRLVVVLCAIDGHDVRAVARLLNLPEGTVKSRLHAARQQLRERLDDR
jgi:RNA polymerase sigma-70 factor (ECF subfamily)